MQAVRGINLNTNNMTHDFKLGGIDLIISYDETHGDIEMGTILMRTTTGFADVTDLVHEMSGWSRGHVLENIEGEIRESLQERPSFLDNN